MPRILSLLLFPLVLAGCFSADMDIDFSDGETLQLGTTMDLGQDLYGFLSMPQAINSNPCNGMDLRLENARVICTSEDMVTIEALFADQQPGSMLPVSRDVGPFVGITFEEVDPRTIKLTIPLRVDPPTDHIVTDESLLQFVDALDGETMDFSVTAEQIIFTNGLVSSDRTQAALSLPMAQMLEPVQETPQVFEVIFRY